MTQSLLHRLQRVPSRLDQHQTPWIKPGLRQGSREEIAPPEDPQHRSRTTREQAGSKQRRRGSMLYLRAAASDLMHRAEAKAATGQMPIDALELERQEGTGTVPERSTLECRHLRTQDGKLCFLHLSLPHSTR